MESFKKNMGILLVDAQKASIMMATFCPQLISLVTSDANAQAGFARFIFAVNNIIIKAGMGASIFDNSMTVAIQGGSVVIITPTLVNNPSSEHLRL
ncbi:MAG: hypothetical protein K2X98_01435 [Alphaproteobacteria bacterium]|nr:hypothetical protein [Alphaproteobacteria bacterium]